METTGHPQVMMKALHKLRSAHWKSPPALDIICVWKTQHSMYTFQEYFTIGSLKTLTQEMDNSNRSPKSIDHVQPIKKVSKYIDLTPVSSYIWFALQLMRGVWGFQCAKLYLISQGHLLQQLTHLHFPASILGFPLKAWEHPHLFFFFFCALPQDLSTALDKTQKKKKKEAIIFFSRLFFCTL